MKAGIFLTVFFITTTFFTKVPNAIFESNVYKQGIYDITDIAEVKATAMLTTPNAVTSLIIIDPRGNQIFFKKFDTVNEEINLGTVKDEDLIAIIGKGDIAITISR